LYACRDQKVDISAAAAAVEGAGNVSRNLADGQQQKLLTPPRQPSSSSNSNSAALCIVDSI